MFSFNSFRKFAQFNRLKAVGIETYAHFQYSWTINKSLVFNLLLKLIGTVISESYAILGEIGCWSCFPAILK